MRHAHFTPSLAVVFEGGFFNTKRLIVVGVHKPTVNRYRIPCVCHGRNSQIRTFIRVRLNNRCVRSNTVYKYGISYRRILNVPVFVCSITAVRDNRTAFNRRIDGRITVRTQRPVYHIQAKAKRRITDAFVSQNIKTVRPIVPACVFKQKGAIRSGIRPRLIIRTRRHLEKMYVVYVAGEIHIIHVNNVVPRSRISRYSLTIEIYVKRIIFRRRNTFLRHKRIFRRRAILRLNSSPSKIYVLRRSSFCRNVYAQGNTQTKRNHKNKGAYCRPKFFHHFHCFILHYS